MARFVTLYSGSSGNCTLIDTGDGVVLIDMGCSCKRTLSEMYALGYSACDVRAILITHEHSDHIGGLMTFLRHYRVPLYGPERSLTYLRNNSLVPDDAALNTIAPREAFSLGALNVCGFTTSHDSEDCMGYRLTFSDGRSIAVATDLGTVSDEVYESLCGCELVALESNYDENMLMVGRYPYYLKNRIRSSFGHLSNDDCARCAARLAESGTREIVLMHLSRENNLPEIALTNCLCAIENSEADESAVRVLVAPRSSVGEIMEI